MPSAVCKRLGIVFDIEDYSSVLDPSSNEDAIEVQRMSILAKARLTHRRIEEPVAGNYSDGTCKAFEGSGKTPDH